MKGITSGFLPQNNINKAPNIVAPEREVHGKTAAITWNNPKKIPRLNETGSPLYSLDYFSNNFPKSSIDISCSSNFTPSLITLKILFSNARS